MIGWIYDINTTNNTAYSNILILDISHKNMLDNNGNINNKNDDDDSKNVSDNSKSNNGNNNNVPSIRDFLETLDRKYGSGLFTQYLDNFISESIDVLDILTISNNDFESLGIKKIGIRQKIIREAEQYKI